jgi:streptomycin 6-kinase
VAVIKIPEPVRGKALMFGAGQWLTELPDLVDRLALEWSIEVGRSYPDSTEALVTEAVLADGTPAVLKLCVPNRGDAARHEILTLQLVNGDGCPRLLRHDLANGAMLLERLGRPMDALGLPAARRHELLAAAAARIWRPITGYDLRSGADKGRWLAEDITQQWARLGEPCTARAIEHALTCAASRVAGHDQERAVLVHGDVHQWNALEAADGFKLVDPDGLIAEAEYDLGTIIREDPLELMHGDPRDWARSLARQCGKDATAIWEWGVAERVSTGLLCTEIGLQPVGREMLAAADHLASQHWTER